MMDDSCGSVAEMNKYQKLGCRMDEIKVCTKSGRSQVTRVPVSRCCVWTMAGRTLPPPLFTLHRSPTPESTLPVDCVATKS